MANKRIVRDACRVRVEREELKALRKLAPRLNKVPVLKALLERIEDDLSGPGGVQTELLIKEARETVLNNLHTLDNNDIEIDDDAPFSEADDGTWVGAWLWLPKDPGEDGDEEHEHQWGPVERAHMTGNPHRKCQVPGCKQITLDLEDE